MQQLNKFLKYLSVQNYSEHTITNYSFILRLFIVYIRAIPREIPDVILDDVVDYLSILKTEGYSGNTIKLRIIALKSFFNYLYQQKIFDRRLDIPLPKLEKRTIKILSIEEVKRILNKIEFKTIRDYRDRAIIELLYTSGLRISEFINLTSDNFQWIKLKRASKKQHLQIHVKGKGKQERSIYINEITANVVMNYLSMRTDNSDYIFISHHGAEVDKPLSKIIVRKILRKRAKDARVSKHIYPHMLRHSIATHLLMSKKVDVFTLQNFLGHQSIESTRQYIELLDMGFRDACEKVIPEILYSNRKQEED